MDEIVKKIHQYTDEKSGNLIECADRIHEYVEPSGREYQSAQVLEQLLEDNGFRVGDTHDNKVNFTLAKLAQQSMMTMGLPAYTDGELAYVAEIADAVGVEGCDGLFDRWALPADHTVKKDNGSTDLADVSQVVPTINMFAACFCKNTPMHSWAVTAQSKHSTAYKGMLSAVRALAYMAARIIMEPELLGAVRAEFESITQE